MAATVTNLKIDHEGGTDRGLFATWEWSKSSTTDHYEVWWEYQTPNKVWITNSESSEKREQATYSYPDNAISVRVRVMPVAQNKSGGDTPRWKSQYSKTVYYKVPNPSGISVDGKKYDAPEGLTLNIEADTDRTVHAKWKWPYGQVEYYDVEWQYQTSDKRWYYAPSDQPTVKESTYNAPNNAIAVRCHVRPISNIAYETDTTIRYFWISKFTSWVQLTFPTDDDSSILRPNAPNKLTIGIQNGTDSTLYATWDFKNHSITDHYEVHWQYYTGDKDGSGKAVWYDDGITNTSVKNITYDPKDNAKQVRYTVLPVAKELNGRPRFIGKTSSIKKYTGLTPKDPNTNITKIKVQKEKNNATSLVATWSWSKHSQTDHYEVEWRYQTGNKDKDGKTIWFYPSGSTSAAQNATYSYPANATKIQVRIKPVAKSSQWVKDWTAWAPSAGFAFPVPKTRITELKKTVTRLTLDIQNGTQRTIIASWSWSQKNTDGYKVVWQYTSGDGIWFEGSKTDLESNTYSLYSAPDNAIKVRVKVRPMAKKHKVQNVDTAYWSANASKWYSYSLSEVNHTPVQASAPAVSMNGLTLTAELNTYDANTRVVEFQIVKNDASLVTTIRSAVDTNHSAISHKVDIGGEYKVRARGLYPINNKTVASIVRTTSTANAYVGEWSEYSDNYGTIPANPKEIVSHTVISLTVVQLTWTAVKNVTGYRIEYTTNKDYFDKSDSVKSKEPAGGTNTYILDDIEPGNRYYVRVRAVNALGNSGWTPIYSFIVGTKPSPPTTWSDSSTCIIGEKMYLYWVHNSEDESSQKAATVALKVNNGETTYYEPTCMSDGTTPSYYILDSKAVATEAMQDDQDSDVLDSNGNQILFRSVTEYPENTVIKWRIRTKGINGEWSDWSTTRQIVIYALPALELYVGSSRVMNDKQYEVNKYPLIIHGEAFPTSQQAISYNVSIIANESYTTFDYDGRERSVRDQEEIFSRYIPATGNALDLELNASDVNLDSEITYTVKVTAGMNSGLIAEETWTFTARWDTDILVPDAEVTIDKDRLVAFIRPFCNDDYGELMDGVTLSVYRHDYDGRLIELATGLDNGDITIVDSHPSLNYARYRVIAMDTDSGEIGWRDIPPEYVGETSIIIQWDERWEPFSTNNGEYEDALADFESMQSMVRLPYNVEVSESNSIDVALNEYIGRAHPVSYYGTQLGIKGDWNAVIPRDDIETIYALRRLAIYRGDVYVREPSGVGYWANVNVSFSKRYSEMTIPVTINVVRVEGDD